MNEGDIPRDTRVDRSKNNTGLSRALPLDAGEQVEVMESGDPFYLIDQAVSVIQAI